MRQQLGSVSARVHLHRSTSKRFAQGGPGLGQHAVSWRKLAVHSCRQGRSAFGAVLMDRRGAGGSRIEPVCYGPGFNNCLHRPHRRGRVYMEYTRYGDIRMHSYGRVYAGVGIEPAMRHWAGEAGQERESVRTDGADERGRLASGQDEPTQVPAGWWASINRKDNNCE